MIEAAPERLAKISARAPSLQPIVCLIAAPPSPLFAPATFGLNGVARGRPGPVRRVENAGTARRREVWIFAARKTVVAVAGEGERPPWPDSDELSLRMKMTMGPRGDISRRPIGCYIRALYVTVTTISPVGVLTLLGETTMVDLNSVIIRKAYEDFAVGNIPRFSRFSTPASHGTFPVIVPYQATIPVTIRSEASFNARWSFREARSAWMCIMCWLKTISLSPWLP